MNGESRTFTILTLLGISFCLLATAFVRNLWGRPVPLTPNPLASPEVTNTATARLSYAERIRMKDDVSLFDCYGCHDRTKPPVLRFDTNQNLIIPTEHEDLVMGHGTHNRNNNCFNCHNEANLELLQTRDGRGLKLSESTPLCGSCHGPTYRDWEAGLHGRTSGYWDRQAGPSDRKDCVSCHNPHHPKFPPRQPAPGPNPLRPGAKPARVHAKAH